MEPELTFDEWFERLKRTPRNDGAAITDADRDHFLNAYFLEGYSVESALQEEARLADQRT